MIIEKKTWPELFQDISDGKKKFDVRMADFKCRVGDTLILKEWLPDKEDYTGRELEKEVSYVLKTKYHPFWSKDQSSKYGFQIIGFKQEEEKKPEEIIKSEN